MDTRARTRPLLRRAGILAALTALLVPAAAGTATADAAKRKKPRSPVVTKITPQTAFVGETLTIRGRHFVRGMNKNTVAFKRPGAKAVFVKAEKGTTKLLQVVLPKRLEKVLAVVNGAPAPTKLQVRVLAKRFGKRFTSRSRSPLVSPERPPAPPVPPAAAPDADCDGDGQLNRVDGDDDNDLLGDEQERTLKLDGCLTDTDGDGVEDGFEYKSALDLNDDRYQGDPSVVQPYPVKKPYPNPLFADAGIDYDGDSLRLADEYALWKYTYQVNHTATRTLEPLSYSDGMQHSLHRFENGRNVPAMRTVDYGMRAQFLAWATNNRYLTVLIPATGEFGPEYSGWHDIRDINMVNGVEQADDADGDANRNGFVSDDERDEDADGLSNYDENTGRMTPAYWAACYTMEKPWPTAYAGTRIDDPDTDGDGVRDGADDQDHDDLPNLMELSRYMASSGLDDSEADKPCKVKESLISKINGQEELAKVNHPLAYGRVHPFNPCLPFKRSRTCPTRPPIDGGGAPFDGSPNWFSLD